MCSSDLKGQLVGFDDRGLIVRQREIGGYTRGLVATPDYIYVGVSFMRHVGGKSKSARVAVLDRKDWKGVDAFDVPVQEVYDLVAAPSSLIPALVKADWLDTLAGLQPEGRSEWFICDPLKAYDMRAVLHIEPPVQAECNTIFKMPVRIINTGNGRLVSAPPYPIELVYIWRTFDNRTINSRTIRCELPSPIGPGDEVSVNMQVATPAMAGRFRLSVTLTQLGLASFEQVDPKSAAHTMIEVISLRS